MVLTISLYFNRFRVLAVLLLLLAVQLTHATTAPHNTSEPYLLILYDQPRSVGTIPTQRVAALWLAAFAAVYPPPFRVVVAGFGETVEGQMNATLTHLDDLAPLQRQITELSSQGKVTDLEALFSYLNSAPLPQEAIAVVVISDGKPEIWDRALGYISPRVVADDRYAQLHQQRLKLKKAGLDRFKLYDQLGAAYLRRNLQLIPPHLAKIRATLGNRLVLIDTLGTYPHLPKWAQQMGATYLHLITKGGDLTTQLHSTLTRLTPPLGVKSSPAPTPPPTLVAPTTAVPPSVEPLNPPIRIELPLPQREPPLNSTEPTPVATPTADRNPPTRIEIPLPKQESIPVANEPNSPTTAAAPPPLEPTASSPPTSDSLRDLVWLIAALLVIAALFRVKSYLKTQKSRHLKSLEEEAARIARELIERDRERVIAEAKSRRKTVLTESRHFFTHERRSSLRFPLNPGVLKAIWIDAEGEEQQGDVIDVSMNSIQFFCTQALPATLDRIVAPALDRSLPITQATLHQRDPNRAIAQIHEFGNGLDGRMQWLELIPRLYQPEL